MAEIRLTKVEQGQTKIKNVPIAVTPEGFWCCPSPAVFHKTAKTQNPPNKLKTSPPTPTPTAAALQKKRTSVTKKKQATHASKVDLVSNEQKPPDSDASLSSLPSITERTPRLKAENVARKVSIEFGEPGTSDLKLILLGKQGFSVKLSVHKNILTVNSSFFANKISDEQLVLPCIEIVDCDDVEIYVETVGLMYCKELKQRLIKQNVSHVLRILKIAEQLGFTSCIKSCLEYLEAVPWVGEEEEDEVVTSVLRLQDEGIGVTPVLKRVSSDISKPPKETLSQILQLVLKSNEERGRHEMKSIVLKLLRESNNLPSCSGSIDICNQIIYESCRSCLDLLLAAFRQASESACTSNLNNCREPFLKQISVEADNLSWLLEILAERQSADEFAVMWASQQELASLHMKLPVMSRYHVSCITGRLFVGIGRGELLPPKDIRHLLLQTWLQPLINDYSWLHHGCRSFNCNVVEEGIGRTILTLSLEQQQSIFLGWLGSYLKAGDSCPNLQKAFEVWWRRTFVRPYSYSVSLPQPPSTMTLEVVEK